MRAGVIRRPGSTHALPVLSERDRAGAFCVPHSVGVSRIRLSSAARSGDAARERVRWAGPLGTSHQHVHLACTTHMSVSHDMHVPRCPPRLASPRSRLGYNIVTIFTEISRETSPRRPPLWSALRCLARGPATPLLFPHPPSRLQPSHLHLSLPGPACVLLGCHSYPPTRLSRSGLLERRQCLIQLTQPVIRISIDAAGSSPCEPGSSDAQAVRTPYPFSPRGIAQGRFAYRTVWELVGSGYRAQLDRVMQHGSVCGGPVPSEPVTSMCT